jgi:hypothetical protein
MSVDIRTVNDRLEFGVPRFLFKAPIEAIPDIELYDVDTRRPAIHHDGSDRIVHFAVERRRQLAIGAVVIDANESGR